MDRTLALAKLVIGAVLVAGGSVLWALTGAGEPGAAMIAAGGVLIPSGAAGARGPASVE